MCLLRRDKLLIFNYPAPPPKKKSLWLDWIFVSNNSVLIKQILKTFFCDFVLVFDVLQPCESALGKDCCLWAQQGCTKHPKG